MNEESARNVAIFKIVCTDFYTYRAIERCQKSTIFADRGIYEKTGNAAATRFGPVRCVLPIGAVGNLREHVRRYVRSTPIKMRIYKEVLYSSEVSLG